MKRIHSLLLFLLLSLPAISQSLKVYPIGSTQIAIADTDGLQIVSSSVVSWYFGPDDIQLQTGSRTRFVKPSQFQKQDGSVYGATSLIARLAWLSALQSAGQGTTSGAVSSGDVATAVSSYLSSLTTTESTTGPNIQLPGGQRVNGKVNQNGTVQVWQTWDMKGIKWVGNAPLVYSTKIYPVSNTSRTDDIRLFGATSTGGIDGGQSRVGQSQTLNASSLNTFTVNTNMPGDSVRYLQVFVGIVPANTSTEAVFYLGNSTLTFNGSPATLVGTQLFNATAPDALNAVTEIAGTGTTTSSGGVTIVTPVASRLKNKTINLLGNSLTAGYMIPHSQTYSGVIVGRNNMTERVYAISGTTLAKPPRNIQGSQATQANCFLNRYAAMDNTADIVLVEGGTNDPINGIVVGNPGSTSDTTFYGAMKIIVPALIAKFPSAKIAFVTPANYGEPGNTFYQAYVTAMLDVCGWYGVPVLDLSRKSRLSPYVPAQAAAYYLPNDKVHWNTAGMLIEAGVVEDFLNSL